MFFVLCSLVVIAPWALYNSRLYGGPIVVDTSGAYNLLLGARTAYDGVRRDAPARDFVLALLGQRPPESAGATCLPHPGPLPSQAARQTAMIREALCLISARPAAYATKSLAELVDLFQINYTGDERFTDGFTTGRLSPAYALGLFLFDDTLYVLVLPLAVIGWARLRKDEGGGRKAEGLPKDEGGGQKADTAMNCPPFILHPSSFILLWWLYNIVVAPLLFAINRFRLPLLPFAFVYASYALAAPPRRRGARWPARSLVWAGLALALLLVATTPYAYVRPQGAIHPSYVGPYPSSLASTRLALAARPRYLRTRQFLAALAAGDTAAAAALLQSGELAAERAGKTAADTTTLGRALLAAAQGRPDDGLRLLPGFEQIRQQRDVEAAVVRGDLLRSLGDLQGARAALGPTFVDDANPVEWAWEWLRPAATRRIDLAGDLDLGYVAGCYLGEYDPSVDATFRWCGDGARLRFPGAGNGATQQLALRADGRFWPTDLPLTPAQVIVDGRAVGAFTPDRAAVREFVVALPPAPPGADVVVTLRTATFIPGAADYLRQQGPQAGQARRLGVRIDWAELR